jgi:hexosaminidase
MYSLLALLRSSRFVGPLVLLLPILSLAQPAVPGPMPAHPLMPAPAELEVAEGRLAIGTGFRVALRGHVDARLAAAVARTTRRWEERTGLAFPREATMVPAHATLVIDCGGPSPDWPRLGENESYQLQVSPRQASLRAETVTGVLRGLETWAQLLTGDARGWYVPTVTVRDAPRFPWRGLLIDVARHWQPVDVIKRQIDGMALVKLNVLHLHLTNDQGFRIESRTRPELHQLGSDGQYYSHHDIREIIGYAAARGIRVVPEFNVPGHATSWLVGFPELGSQPGPYELVRTWGDFDPTLDPTNEAVYDLLDDLLGEMAALFPDAYLHLGSDELNGRHWDANPRIQQFIRDNHLNGNAGLQMYFHQRVQEILAKHGKRMVGGADVLQPGLPQDAIIQSWRGREAHVAAARAGYSSIFSHGYSIDLMHPAADHYQNDPVPEDGSLSREEERRVLGGEATMWSEWVTPETIDSRIWPRTAAIAERLWSPREVKDVDDMYRRLHYVSRRLEEAGLQHERNRDPMLRRFAGDTARQTDLRAVRALVDVIEPVKQHQRNQQQPGVTQFTPLTGIADLARPDSAEARVLAQQVKSLLIGEIASDAERAVREKLLGWSRVAQELERGLAQTSPRVREQLPLLWAMQAAIGVGTAALEALAAGRPPPAGWREEQLAALERHGRAHGPVELALIQPFRWLVIGAAEQARRAEMDPESFWRFVEEAAGPPLQMPAQ